MRWLTATVESHAQHFAESTQTIDVLNWSHRAFYVCISVSRCRLHDECAVITITCVAMRPVNVCLCVALTQQPFATLCGEWDWIFGYFFVLRIFKSPQLPYIWHRSSDLQNSMQTRLNSTGEQQNEYFLQPCRRPWMAMTLIFNTDSVRHVD